MCGSRREFTLLFVTREGAPRNAENSVGLRSSRLRNRSMGYDGEGAESKNVILPHVAASHGARLSPTYLSASVRWLHQQLSGMVDARLFRPSQERPCPSNERSPPRGAPLPHNVPSRSRWHALIERNPANKPPHTWAKPALAAIPILRFANPIR